MTKESNNIWDAIESDNINAANLKLRSQLMMEVSDYVKASGFTQAQVAKNLGISQPRLNDVLKGKMKNARLIDWSICLPLSVIT